ncbi:MAG: T9SS type A sorting domain-containing protein [Bacteroidota bacterium]|nr:T9SS type A sorting domain-containing protein [Bacteroidota bacterium]MDP3144683.1 T9SS type A sorting domain-containing protein [Bacteroidota bacterium]MDP3557019.1 T9SS type A sorting domain-containing protein [Bacteroidota bacterium]
MQTIGLRENINDLKLKIYPNPSNETITISAPINHDDLHFILLDMFGNEILTSEKFNINVRNLKNGIYVIKGINTKNNEVIVTKFIKN